jgi:2-C-methyl-D-erythritol 4-phosphate cytidylyltransferase
MKREHVAAVVLAAGKGTRMESSVHKQYMELEGKPLIYYALKTFEESEVEKVILVTGKGEMDYCQKEIVEKYGFSKVTAVVEGGKERYHSVFAGLKAAKGCEYVLIHDGARPCVTRQIIERSIDGAIQYGACVAGMPVKDTIKIADEQGYSSVTPDRSKLWMIQTPQSFEYQLVYDAYEKLLSDEKYQKGITDDAMVVESMTDYKVKLIFGDYGNIKVTTPEDMEIAEIMLRRSHNIHTI